MEADWEIEIGGDAPVIDACWPGSVDLRSAPEKALQLREVIELPALGSALAALNASGSSFYTVKGDVWPNQNPGRDPVQEIDPIEFDAAPELAQYAVACYVDLLPRDSQYWTDPQDVIAWCQRVCAALRAISLSCSRVDLVARRAVIAQERFAIGVTAYTAACGASEASAQTQLAAALQRLTECVLSADLGDAVR